MSTRLFAVLFTALFLIGAFPVLFVQPFGSANAGVTAGFLLPAQNGYYVMTGVATGLAAAWMGAEAILVLPLCVLLMLVLGALIAINAPDYRATHGFILGTVLLFAMSVSLMRNKSVFLFIVPVSLWAYFSGSGFMQHIPSITTPLFFLMGTIVSTALMLAMGVALGSALGDRLHQGMRRLKNSVAYMMLLSLF